MFFFIFVTFLTFSNVFYSLGTFFSSMVRAARVAGSQNILHVTRAWLVGWSWSVVFTVVCVVTTHVDNELRTS